MTTEEKLIKSKMNLLDLAAYLKNVSEACRVMGYSRDTFYRVKKAYEEGGVEALKEKSRRKPNIKNRVSEEVERAVVAFALEEPAFGQKRASDTLRQRGVFISPAGVRCVAAGRARGQDRRGTDRISAAGDGEGGRREEHSRRDRD